MTQTVIVMVSRLAALILLSFALQVKAALTDNNCTTVTAGGTIFTPESTVCQNVASLQACEQLFGGTVPDPAVVAGGLVSSRPEGCFTVNTGSVLSPEVKQAAITSCAQYCGYCCATPDYNCKNTPNPRIDCGQVTQPMCKDAQWREIIAQDCPGACGFCALGGCIDAAVDCATQPTICANPALSNFTMYNCKRTCGTCTGNGMTTLFPGGGVGGCADSAINCASWVRNGFCQSTWYNSVQKARYCGISCGLCGGFGGLSGMMTTQSFFG